MERQLVSFDGVRAAVRRRFPELEPPLDEVISVLGVMYAPRPSDERATIREELVAVSKEVAALARNESRDTGPDEELVRLCERRNHLRDSLLHLREHVTTTEPRTEDGVAYLATTVTTSDETALLRNRRGTWWARTLLHGVELLRAAGHTRTQALDIMNELGALTGHFPDARRLRAARADPERKIPRSDFATRDRELLLEQYKAEKRRRRQRGARPMLSRKQMLAERWRLKRSHIFLWDLTN